MTTEPAAVDRPRIHLLNPLANLGGSELRTVALYEKLRPDADVALWTEHPPWSELAQLPIQRIDEAADIYPRGGTLVIVGVYFFPLSSWIARTSFDRVVIVYNTFSLPKLEGLIGQLESAGLPRPEMVYASELMRRSIEQPLTMGMPPSRVDWLETCASIARRVHPRSAVHPSPIDLTTFQAVARTRSNDPFVVGRLSRDTPDKFHPDDPAFFRELAGRGFRVRLMGATSIADRLEGVPGIEILRAGAEPAASFLASLDAFVYRVSPSRWLEAFGRVIIEAMATGLPCVCEWRGGYVEVIEDGKSGCLFRKPEQALELLTRLRDDPELRGRIGEAARETVRQLYHPERQRALLSFYLSR
jgi:glycosyltransferase involved in cell wall biosynthesis